MSKVLQLTKQLKNSVFNLAFFILQAYNVTVVIVIKEYVFLIKIKIIKVAIQDLQIIKFKKEEFL